MNIAFRNTMISVLAPLALSACGQPPHTHKADNGTVPDAGYGWTNPNDPRSGKVEWEPGDNNPAIPHIHAGTVEGKWQPDEGYDFTSSDSLAVTWKAGAESTSHPHVSSAANEGKWHADDGYVWVDPAAASMDVKWQAEQPNSTYPHIVSADEEGKWLPEPGYKFVDPQKNVDVVWDPGSTNQNVAHITAGQTEGQWVADEGYEFITHDGKTYVAQKDQPIDWGNIAADGGIAIAANSCAQDQENDGILQTFLMRPFCRQLRDSAIDDAVKSFAPAPQ